MKDEIKEILENIKRQNEWKGIEYFKTPLSTEQANKLLDYITNLQEENEHLRTQVNRYENPDDMTLFYMWIDEKAKDKMKALQKENERLKEVVENLTTMTVCGDRKQIKNTAQHKLEQCNSRIDKARHKLNIMFSNGNEDIILDDLLELDKILGGNNE